MTTNYQVRMATNPVDYRQYDTARIRQEYVLESVFVAEQINLLYSHEDRFIVGGIQPVEQTLTLTTIDPLKADYFLERRELGMINIGGKAMVTADGESYEVGHKEALYIGRGNKEVTFKSVDPSQPAKLYINSAQAHTAYPNKLIDGASANVLELGSQETSNHRLINQFIIQSTVKTCQLQMGMTALQPGSVWNTMPAHQHDRRMEAYFYFEIDENQAVSHFMGEPEHTRNIWLQNEQAVISPAWSIHSGAGTSNYTFIWGMAGENLDYGDMDVYQASELR